MTQAEKEMFHKNYSYMWQKLNTTPYSVKGPSAYSPYSALSKFDSASVPVRLKRNHIGGLAFVLSASDGPFSTG